MKRPLKRIRFLALSALVGGRSPAADQPTIIVCLSDDRGRGERDWWRVESQ